MSNVKAKTTRPDRLSEIENLLTEEVGRLRKIVRLEEDDAVRENARRQLEEIRAAQSSVARVLDLVERTKMLGSLSVQLR